MIDKNQRRDTFDKVALLYDQVRPSYPDALFDDVIALSHIPPKADILEIGCGTGQATLPFARRGYRIHCIELGASLASVAQRKLVKYSNAEVSIGAFEEWNIQDASYDLLISATAFHWIDPAVRYQKAAKVLKPTGAIALFWNTHVQTEISADFFQAVQAVYRHVLPSTEKEFSGLPHLDAVPTPIKDEIEHTNLFGAVTVSKYAWNVVYNAMTYVNLLNTYSDHLSLDDMTREDLFKGIIKLIDNQFDGHITKEYLTLLYLAHRK